MTFPRVISALEKWEARSPLPLIFYAYFHFPLTTIASQNGPISKVNDILAAVETGMFTVD